MPRRQPTFPLVIASVALLAVLVAGVVILFDRDSGTAGGSDEAHRDLDEAIAFLEEAIRVDIRPLEGEVLYWHNETYERDGSQVAPVRESWTRIGPDGDIVESLNREWDDSGNLRDERYSDEPRGAQWAKGEAAAARSGLVDGSAALVELTDETVTVEMNFGRSDWSGVGHAQGIDAPEAEVMRMTIDQRGTAIGRDIIIRTATGDEVLVQSHSTQMEIVDDMPEPGGAM